MAVSKDKLSPFEKLTRISTNPDQITFLSLFSCLRVIIAANNGYTIANLIHLIYKEDLLL